MSTSTAELTLIMRAQNFADEGIAKLKGSLDGVREKAGQITTAFMTAARSIGRELSNVLINVLNGQDIGAAAAQAGILMAASLVGHFGEQLLVKLAASTFVQGIAATLAGLGTAIGSAIAAAIPIGMALLPVLLIAAVAAAVLYLITHPEVLQAVNRFAESVIKWIINGLVTLGQKLVGVFTEAFEKVKARVEKLVGDIVETIKGIVKAVSDAIASLNLLKDHTPQEAYNYHATGQVPGHAAGGWVGLNGPEFALLGEKGPEYVVPNHQLGSMGEGHGHDLILDGDKIGRAVSSRFYRDGQRLPARSD